MCRRLEPVLNTTEVTFTLSHRQGINLNTAASFGFGFDWVVINPSRVVSNQGEQAVDECEQTVRGKLVEQQEEGRRPAGSNYLPISHRQ